MYFMVRASFFCSSHLTLMQILKILRYNHGLHHHFCPVYLTCNMFDPISLSWMQMLRQNIDFLWTNILWFACSGLGALDLRHLWSCQLYFIVLSHACQDMIHGKLLNWNGPITCWNFYICILPAWTCLARPSLNNKTLVLQHSNQFVAMLNEFLVIFFIKPSLGNFDREFPLREWGKL